MTTKRKRDEIDERLADERVLWALKYENAVFGEFYRLTAILQRFQDAERLRKQNDGDSVPMQLEHSGDQTSSVSHAHTPGADA